MKIQEGYVESKNMIASVRNNLESLDEGLDYYHVIANNIVGDEFNLSADFGHQTVADFRRDKTYIEFSSSNYDSAIKFLAEVKSHPHEIYKKIKVIKNDKKYLEIRFSRDW